MSCDKMTGERLINIGNATLPAFDLIMENERRRRYLTMTDAA
jgi:hypothetical protein